MQNVQWTFALQRPERSGDLEPSSPGGARKHKKDGIQSDTIFLCFFESARRDSNPRPRPWQGRAPPTEPLAQRAGDGNRTHISSLEGWCSTTELHPHCNALTIIPQFPENASIFLIFYFAEFSIRFNSGNIVLNIVIKQKLPPITFDTGSAKNTPFVPICNA